MRGAFPALVFSGRRKSVVTPKKTQPIHLVWIGCVPFREGAGVFQLERFALEWNSGRHVPACMGHVCAGACALFRPALRVADMAPQAAPQARLCRKDIACSGGEGSRALPDFGSMFKTNMPGADQRSVPYSSSPTGSSHSLLVFSPGTSTARWENQLSFAAPCQCLTPAGMCTTSPG